VCAIGENDEQAEEIREKMLPHPEQAILAESVGTASPYDTHQQAPQQAAIPPFPILLNGSVSTVLDQAREFAKAGVGVMDLILDFGGLSIDEILANLRRLGNDVLPTLHTFPS
jgi:alkanesulfonate monooxygenase SsuD/methylene tetrahydromethanopterin reductase-like flavin-dependent oxidoreductase (luciferase family)